MKINSAVRVSSSY